MRSTTVKNKIIISFGMILLLMGAIGVFGYIRLEQIEMQADGVEADTLPGLYQTGQIRDALYEGRIITDEILRAPDRDSAATLTASLEQSRTRLNRALDVYDATIEADRDRQLFAEFKRMLADYERPQDEVIRTGAAARTQYEARFDAVMEAAQNLSAKNKEWGIDRATHVRSGIHSLQQTFLIVFGIALLASLAFSYHLLRTISRPLGQLMGLIDVMRQGDFTQRMEIERQDEFGTLGEGFNRMADEIMGLVGQVQKSGIRVSTSMTEIAATSKQQQATANEIAASTTEIGATSREISATSKELVRTMNDVAAVAEHAAGLAGSGQSGLHHMGETMGQVMEAAGTINAKLAILNEKAGNITQVVTTITKIADQTNLLSLNAAIEAEKAGEYGRGFAVVSAEIRRLADQTAVATFDIEEMVKEIQSAVSAGVMGMDKFSEEVRRGLRDVQQVGDTLSEVIDQVQTLVPRFDAVNEGMEAQAAGAEQISEALVQLSETTRQTVETLHQSNAAIDDLSQVSAGLHASVSRFKLAS